MNKVAHNANVSQLTQQTMDLTAKINARLDTGLTMEQSVIAGDRFQAGMDKFLADKDYGNNMTQAEKDAFKKASEDMMLICDAKQLDRLKHTLLDLPLMTITLPYIAVPKGEALLSPAGFHETDLVFQAIDNAYESKQFPSVHDLPTRRRGWQVFDLTKLFAQVERMNSGEQK